MVVLCVLVCSGVFLHVQLLTFCYFQAQSREIQRVWEECVVREQGATGENSCDWSTSSAIRNMSRWMMKTPEHTWGTPGVSGWGGGNSYNMSTFGAKLSKWAAIVFILVCLFPVLLFF